MNQHQQDINDELEEISPFLHRLRQQQPQTGFEVPPNYFSQLENQILEHCQTETTQVTAQSDPNNDGHWSRFWHAVWHLIFRPVPMLGFATMIGLIVLVARQSWTTIPMAAPSYQTQLAALSDNEIQEYVLENIDDFDDELVLNTEDTDILENVTPPVLDEALENELLDGLDDDDLF